MQMYAWLDYAICIYHVCNMIYECEIFIEMYLFSLTSAGELWEVKFRTAVGDEVREHLQTLFRMTLLGIPASCSRIFRWVFLIST